MRLRYLLIGLLALVIACEDDGPTSAGDPAPPEPEGTLAPLELPDDHVAIEIVAHIVPRRSPRPPPSGTPEPGEYTIASIRWGGQAEWSDDRLRGSETQHSGTVDTAPMRALFDALRRDGVFEDPNAGGGGVPFHSDYITIAVNAGGTHPLRLTSGHERPINPVWVDKLRLTGTSMDQAFEAEIAEMSADDQSFRRRWRSVRLAVAEMLPAAPDPEPPPAPPERRPLDIPSDHVVILIQSHDMRDPEPGGPSVRPSKLITSIRWDGGAEWSDDRSYGDGESRSGRVDRARVRAFIEELREEGVFDDTMRYASGVPGGSRYLTIQLNLGEEESLMASVDPHDPGLDRIRHDFDKMWVRLRANIEAMLAANE